MSSNKKRSDAGEWARDVHAWIEAGRRFFPQPVIDEVRETVLVHIRAQLESLDKFVARRPQLSEAGQRSPVANATKTCAGVALKDAVLDDVREHPNTSVAQAAGRLGLRRNSAWNAVSRLTAAGTLVRGGSCGRNGKVETYTFAINEAANAPQETP